MATSPGRGKSHAALASIFPADYADVPLVALFFLVEGEGSSQSEAASTDRLYMIMLSHPVPHENSAHQLPLR